MRVLGSRSRMSRMASVPFTRRSQTLGDMNCLLSSGGESHHRQAIVAIQERAYTFAYDCMIVDDDDADEGQGGEAAQRFLQPRSRSASRLRGITFENWQSVTTMRNAASPHLGFASDPLECNACRHCHRATEGSRVQRSPQPCYDAAKIK